MLVFGKLEGPGAFVGTINAAGTYFYSQPGQGGDYVAILAIDPSTGVLSGGGPNADTTTASGPASVALAQMKSTPISRIGETTPSPCTLWIRARVC